jgi:polyphosphate kinase
MMHRNLDRRVEALVRVEAPELRERLKTMLDFAFADTSLTWTLAGSGEWFPPQKAREDGAASLQVELMRHANENSRT